MTLERLSRRVWRALRMDAWFSIGALLVISATIFVVLRVPTRSGIFPTYLSIPASLLLGAVLVVLWLTGRYKPSRHYRVLAALAVVFLAWFAVVCYLRARSGGTVSEGVLALRTTILPLAICFLFDAGLDKPQRALRALVVLNFAAVLWQLPSWDSIRLSTFLGNSNVYCGVLVMMLPVNLLVIARAGSTPGDRVLKAIGWLNVLAALVLPLWGGSRVVAALLAMSLLGCFLVFSDLWRVGLTLFLLLLPAGTAHVLVWSLNPSDAGYGLYRLLDTSGSTVTLSTPPTPRPSTTTTAAPTRVPTATGAPATTPARSTTSPRTGLTTAPLRHASEASPTTALTAEQERQKLQEQLAYEKASSDSGRAELRKLSIERIVANPWIGDGQVYFDYGNSVYQGKQTAHNFVLEHLNAYGGVGFVLYLGLFAVVMAPGLVRIRPGGPGTRENQVALLVAATLFALSTVQPTMLVSLPVTLLFVIVGGLKHELSDLRRRESTSAPSRQRRLRVVRRERPGVTP